MNEPTLEDAGFAATATTILRDEQTHRLAACLDIDTRVLANGELPILWHWTHFLPIVATAELGLDGHPRRREELEAFPQRMWVGGRVGIERPLRIGVASERASRLVRADRKDGSTGLFWLITVEHVITQGDGVCVREEQDLVLRARSPVPPPGKIREDAPIDDWVEEGSADPVVLFRFSAVTANAHRIHYDRAYAIEVEGYSDLVVHGPLTALLLTHFAARHLQHPVREVSFRAHAPLFANRRFWLTGHANVGGAETLAVRGDHTTAMTLTAS